MRTYSGRTINPVDLRPEDVSIVDIAHHLSHMGARFNGATSWYYPVAQHSVYVAREPCQCMVNDRETKVHHQKKLLHDAGEAYLIDLPRPLKKMKEFEFFKPLEDQVLNTVFEAFDLEPGLPECVHEADNVLLVAEGIALMNYRYYPELRPSTQEIERWTPEQAKDEFLAEFRKLFL
jgi:hypothetical protein